MSPSSTWPAAPAESPWERLTLRTVPPCRTARRPAPAVARPMPARAAARPGKARRPRPAREVEGIVLKFSRWFSPSVNEARYQGARVFMHPGALDHSLSLIREHRSAFVLTAGHDGGEIADSASGCLDLYVKGGKLRLRVRGDNEDGQLALAALDALPYSDLSIGLRKISGTNLPGAPVPMLVIEEASVCEVAVVPKGACPGCRLLV